MQADPCAALFEAFDLTALMANTEGTALLTCQSTEAGQCSADILACFGDETCAGIIEILVASPASAPEEKQDILLTNGWCVKPRITDANTLACVGCLSAAS
jgi:hypothetical protein